MCCSSYNFFTFSTQSFYLFAVDTGNLFGFCKVMYDLPKDSPPLSTTCLAISFPLLEAVVLPLLLSSSSSNSQNQPSNDNKQQSEEEEKAKEEEEEEDEKLSRFNFIIQSINQLPRSSLSSPLISSLSHLFLSILSSNLSLFRSSSQTEVRKQNNKNIEFNFTFSLFSFYLNRGGVFHPSLSHSTISRNLK